jgi:hypothetical protein
MGVNDTPESIKNFIYNWSKWPTPIALKRSQDHERPHYSVLTYDPRPGGSGRAHCRLSRPLDT